MTRVFLLVSLFLVLTAKIFAQCINPPTVTLSSTSGSTCGTTPVTVASNRFGGSATAVGAESGGPDQFPGGVDSG
jgi:hypothetical protein